MVVTVFVISDLTTLIKVVEFISLIEETKVPIDAALKVTLEYVGVNLPPQ